MMIMIFPATSLTEAFWCQNADKMCSPDFSLQSYFLQLQYCRAPGFRAECVVCTEPSEGQGGNYYFR